MTTNNTNAMWQTTWSESGSLKIGQGDFSVLIPNGYGDGYTNYCVIDNASDEADKIRETMSFFTIVTGVFDIYEEDTDDGYGLVVKETVGKPGERYSVYSASDDDINQGCVAFIKL
ncbi:hypothetical protein [Levyella massiliensis]|uniref:hypothetical protein n=1 Tax=Levyella massiliensis TaxID=938289 RepID=UPI003EB902C9